MFRELKTITVRMIAGANVATILLMLFVGYSDRLSPESFPLLSTLGLLFPVFLLINICFLFFWLVFKVRYALIPFAGFVLCYFPITTYFPLNLMGEETPEGSIKVLSYNTLSFAEGEKDADGINRVLAYIHRQDADIVCLQEAMPNGQVKEQMDSLMHQQYPYVRCVPHPSGGNAVMVLSKFPILHSELVPYESKGNMTAAFTLSVDGKKVLLLNNHLETTGLSLEERHEFKSLVKGHMDTSEAERTSKLLFVKLGESAKRRAPEAEAVARYVRQHRGESIILCGDFNDGPISYAHRTIAKELTDCFVASGNGLGISYNRGGFYVRIDNIMCSDDWEPCWCRVDNEIAASDHYPIICCLKKRDNS